MQVRRAAHASAALDGKIYAISGATINADPRHVEVYDPISDTWSPVALIPTERTGFGAAAADGKVYAIGGANRFGTLDSVEAYDPLTNSWSQVAPLLQPRWGLAAAELDGKIYAVGGRDFMTSQPTDRVEAYDPPTNTWSQVAPLPLAREALAVAAANGRLYAFGGQGPPNHSSRVDVYDPITNTWTRAADMPAPRAFHAAAAGADGKIYIIGGQGSFVARGNAMEVYDPSLDKWCASTPLPTGRHSLAAATVGGRIYAIGGQAVGSVVDTVEVFTPSPERWTVVAPMPTARSELAAATAPGADGRPRIYALGGRDADGVALNTVEAYDPETDVWTTVAPMQTRRAELTAATGADGRLYAVGGWDELSRQLSTVEVYDPVSDTWSFVASVRFQCGDGTPPYRVGHASATGPDGRIYAIGGFCPQPTFASGTPSVEAYSSSADTWNFAAPIPHVGVGRFLLAAATAEGPGGSRVYGIGGAVIDAVGTLGIYQWVSAYDPSSDTWSAMSLLPTPRFSLAATTGLDNKIYALGGIGGVGDARNLLSDVDAYDPMTDTWIGLDCITPRSGLAAATGPDGRIYAIGGRQGGRVLSRVEAYVP